MISVLKAIGQAISGRQKLPQHVCLFYRKDGYFVGDVELDLILSENHSKSARVTENPLQDGRAISDGIFQELRDGTLTGLVSNHSVKHSTPPDEQDAETLLDEAENATLENRALNAWRDLKDIMEAGETVTIVTALEVYENVAITNIATSRDGDSGDALEIQISFRQVQTVQLMEDKVSAQVQPSDMNSDINRVSAVGVDSGQNVGMEMSKATMNQLFLGVQ